MRSEKFRALVGQFPDNELHRFSLAQALLGEAKPLEAIEALRVCCEKKPDWMMPRIQLGKTLLAVGERNAARAELERALALAVEQSHETPEAELRALLSDLRAG